MILEKEFKEVISNLSSKEKDKLLFRLLKKDPTLVDRLYFELVDTKSLDEKRQDLEDVVKARVDDMSKTYYSPGYLNMDMRYLSGDISYHVKITKDTYGEVYLNLLMLIKVLQSNSSKLTEVKYGKAYKCCMYIIARTFKILTLISKLHSDYFIDIEDDLRQLGQLITQNEYLMKIAIHNGLDINWLILADIPENIIQIHKDIRKQGFLK